MNLKTLVVVWNLLLIIASVAIIITHNPLIIGFVAGGLGAKAGIDIMECVR